MRKHRIAAVPVDGIGPEVITAGLEVLQAVAGLDGGFAVEAESFDWGSDRYRRTGRMMPEAGVDILRGFDAIYFCAVGDPDIADHITLWQLRLAICPGPDPSPNVRPTLPITRLTRPTPGRGRGGKRM